MHYLTRQRLHIARFHPLMKVLLSLYILSVTAALAVATMKYTDRATWSTGGLADYIHGSGEAADDPFDDPLGGTAEGLALLEGKTRRELVDIVHPHLFTVPIVIFILGHLLHLTGISDGLKLGINVTAFVSFLATFLLPFALLDAPGLAPVLMLTGSAMAVSFVLLCVIPFCSMWWGRPEASSFDAMPKRAP